MKALRLLLVPMFAGALLAGCGDDTTEPEENPFDAFVGSWSATEFSYTLQGGSQSVDLFTFFGSQTFNVTITADGGFTAQLRMPNPQDPLGGDPVTVPLAGTLTLQDNNQVLIDFNQQTEQATGFTDFTASYSFTGSNRLAWVNEDTSFDFDQDGNPEPATLRVVLEKQ